MLDAAFYLRAVYPALVHLDGGVGNYALGHVVLALGRLLVVLDGAGDVLGLGRDLERRVGYLELEGPVLASLEYVVVDDRDLDVLDCLAWGEGDPLVVEVVVHAVFGGPVDGGDVDGNVDTVVAQKLELEDDVGEVLARDGFRALVLAALGAGSARANAF